MTILETSRLRLRTWEERDKKPFARMNGDKEVLRYFPNTLTEEASNGMVDWIEKSIESQGYGLYAVEVKSSGIFIGFVGFAHPNFEADFTPCIEIGWRLDKNAWGKGYATEAAGACLEQGFSTLGFDKIVSFTSEINIPSINVMKKIGLEYQKNFSHPGIDKDNELCEHVLYQMTKAQWLNKTK